MRQFQDKTEDFVAHRIVEMQRIEDYPAKGWVADEEILAEVLEAWR